MSSGQEDREHAGQGDGLKQGAGPDDAVPTTALIYGTDVLRCPGMITDISAAAAEHDGLP